MSVHYFGQSNDYKTENHCAGKKAITASIIGAGWTGSMGLLYNLWYKKSNQNSFHYFNDGNLWLQMDKVGHSYTAYQISSLTSGMLEWSGCSNRNAALIGSGIGLGYQTTLEVFDGFSSDWGFSWHDMSANLIGSSLFVSQELIWKEQRILPKFSYHPTAFAEVRPEVLGSTFEERLFKDYNGQTYWLSFSPFQYFKDSKVPKWVCFSVGYSAHEKLKGDASTYVDENGVTYKAQREWLLSMDIDFSKIPVKRPFLKKTLKQLNYLKIPFPTLMLRNGILHGLPIYF
jgi:hypothetical protein